ncbi:hypothetical protein Poli38472_005647 [Pythium oligandrum]|uniref:Palmitoyltransferase n=1 Tax=Pythium oligandrum TaxID=41045 RepID=A0A8K1FJE2_PYTOL|nr:hypothetical protein Poli38472_005647 [Pythium oligandrum]|eukprot:TMW63029.1 hypothetical protein Poli38472_005647 [Pythium oligandrum]
MQRQPPPQWFLRDPAGIVIAGFCWCVMIVSICALWTSLSFWVGALSPVGFLDGTLLTASIGMCMWSHWQVMTTNPGVVPRHGASEKDDGDVFSEGEEEEMPLTEFENSEDDGSLLVFCDECNMYRPARAMHCETCEGCIVLMDHHCPWVNNCVGIGNHKFFLLFLFYVAVTSVHVLLLVVAEHLTCTRGKPFCGFQAEAFPGRLGVWLLAAACVFGLFCSGMLAMELYSIADDLIFTKIAEEVNVRTGCKSRSPLERHLSVLCGTNGFEWSWFLPTTQRRSRQEWEILGGIPHFGPGDQC